MVKKLTQKRNSILVPSKHFPLQSVIGPGYAKNVKSYFSQKILVTVINVRVPDESYSLVFATMGIDSISTRQNGQNTTEKNSNTNLMLFLCKNKVFKVQMPIQITFS